MAFEQEEHPGSTIIRAVPKQRFNFSGIGSTGGTISIVGAKQIDISPYRLIHVIARFHYDEGLAGGVSWQSSQRVTVSVRAEAPSKEDPSDFIVPTDLGSTSFQNGSDQPPSVKVFIVDPAFAAVGGWLRVYITGTMTMSWPNPDFEVMLSVDIVGKY